MNQHQLINQQINQQIEIKVQIVCLKAQINNLLEQVYYEEQKQNPNIDTLNWLIKRIFRSQSVVDVIENRQYQNKQELELLIDQKHLEYLYAFGKELQPVVKIEKLTTAAVKSATTKTTTTTTTTATTK